MNHPICDSCETVSHCSKNGCIPITPNSIDISAALMEAPAVTLPVEDSSPEPLDNSTAKQWWVQELDALRALPSITADQKRAIATVHHLLKTVAKYVRDATPAAKAGRPEPFPYQRTFNAIAAATEVCAGNVAISVIKFREAFGRAQDPTEPVALPVTDEEVDTALAECSLINEVGTCDEMRRALEGFAKSRAIAAKGQA